MRHLGSFLRENALWLGTCTLISFLSSFGQTFFISAFAGDIRDTFALSNAGWGWLYAAATTASAVAMVFAGGIADHLRVRHLAPMVMAALAASALAMAHVGTLWGLALSVFCLRFFGQSMMSHIAYTAVARWFTASRGRATSIATLGFSTGQAFLPLGFVALTGQTGWRFPWTLVAAILILLAPLVWALMRHERTPQSFAQSSSATGMGGRMWTRTQALRDPFFWLMVPALLGPPTWGTAFFFHQVHLSEVKGWGHATLVAMFPGFTAAAVAGALVSGWLSDRLGTARMLPFYLTGLAAGFALFAAATTPLTGTVAMVLMGLSTGTSGTMMVTLWADAYGTRNIGAIRAMLGAVMVLGTAIGPGLTGALIDLGIDYARQGWGVAAYFLGASALAALAARHLRGT